MATCTWFRPAPLASYSARSAKATSREGLLARPSDGHKVATPMLTVTMRAVVDVGCGRPRSCTAASTRSATAGLKASRLRPVAVHPALRSASTLRPEVLEGVDLVFVRELTGGIYFGTSGREGDTAFDTCTYSREEIRRVAEVAFESAIARRGKVTSVDKANVLESSRLWREIGRAHV